MRRLLFAALAMLAAPAVEAQTAGRSAPPSMPRVTSAPAQGQIGPLAPQSPPRIVDPRTRTPWPDLPVARAPAQALSPASRALAVQQLTRADSPPSIGETVRLSVSAPIGSHGSYVRFTNAHLVDPHRGEAWFSLNHGSLGGGLFIKLPQWPLGLVLVDCDVGGVASTLNWEMLGTGGWQVGSAQRTDGRLFFVVNGGADSTVRIWAAYDWDFLWCDITRVG